MLAAGVQGLMPFASASDTDGPEAGDTVPVPPRRVVGYERRKIHVPESLHLVPRTMVGIGIKRAIGETVVVSLVPRGRSAAHAVSTTPVCRLPKSGAVNRAGGAGLPLAAADVVAALRHGAVDHVVVPLVTGGQ